MRGNSLFPPMWAKSSRKPAGENLPDQGTTHRTFSRLNTAVLRIQSSPWKALLLSHLRCDVVHSRRTLLSGLEERFELGTSFRNSKAGYKSQPRSARTSECGHY